MKRPIKLLINRNLADRLQLAAATLHISNSEVVELALADWLKNEEMRAVKASVEGAVVPRGTSHEL